MTEQKLLPIVSVQAHDVRGEKRWTGRVDMPGGGFLNVLILTGPDGLLAVRNRCPHRDVPMLRGRLDWETGELECPSHGLLLALDGADLRGRPVVERDGTFFMVYDSPSTQHGFPFSRAHPAPGE